MPQETPIVQSLRPIAGKEMPVPENWGHIEVLWGVLALNAQKSAMGPVLSFLLKTSSIVPFFIRV